MPWLARNPEVVATEMEDGAVLLNLESRLYYSLNAVGLEIWRRIESADDADALARSLGGRFEVEGVQARASVSRFIEELQREGLVVADGGEARPAAPTPAEPGTAKGEFAEPELVKHDEPLHEISATPFDPQLPLAE
jgi:hypothetical protein